jgi:uncharacterized membrane protein HdeD (DUF308 family)
MTDGTVSAGPAPTIPAEVNIDVFPWWLVLIQGIVALILGIALLFWTGPTLLVLVTFVGAYWLISGIFGIISIFIDRSHMVRKLLVGILRIVAGIAVLAYPLYSAIFLPALLAIFVGVLGLIMGVVELFAAFSGAGWGRGILGILSIILGLLILANPVISAVTLIWLVAACAIVGGIIAIVFAFRLKSASSTRRTTVSA